MDADLQKIYIDPTNETDKAAETWCWLYSNRDWTYFMQPFFNKGRNTEVYSDMLDLTSGTFPTTSNHINGVIFEQSFMDRGTDPNFGDMVDTCEFLARHHHGDNNLKIISQLHNNLISLNTLKKLTMLDSNSDLDPDTYNGVYGSVYENLPDNPMFPLQDWVDDYDMTGSYVNSPKYKYNIGQAHAIDDFDEGSVWFYITMVEPVDQIDQVVEIEDIMPYVFWWDNRGVKNNGPDVDCYGLSSSAKLNYQEGGWCWSCAHERQDEEVTVTATGEVHKPIVKDEQRWHAVAHTLGVNFGKDTNGHAVLTTDNSGNVYKGAFDPNYAGTDEKWKVHHPSNDFGTNQHEDPIADKYFMGQYSNGETDMVAKAVPGDLNKDILGSMKDRQMVWNLWNVVRHYAYIKYFKNRNKELGSDVSTWTELEAYTKKIVKGIYRTFKQKQWKNEASKIPSTFDDIDGISTNYGEPCLVKWTNSFIEVTSILERNAREHQASLVLFTGDVRLTNDEIEAEKRRLSGKYSTFGELVSNDMARASLTYKEIMESTDSFRVLSLAGMDASDDEDGIRPNTPNAGEEDLHGHFNGHKYGDLPTSYVIGDFQTFQQSLVDATERFGQLVDLDQMYPFAENHLDDVTNRWVRRIQQTVMNKQVVPVYTSMETMDKNVHDLTVEDMKGITFQVVPSLYWKYDWSYNDYMIHRVGKLNAPSSDIKMYDMLGNVWELVRDNWSDRHAGSSGSASVNHIVGTNGDVQTAKHVIKGGAFDQFARNTISPARQKIGRGKSNSTGSSQSNVGFRPSMTFTAYGESGSTVETGPVDLFFLFDASASNDSQIQKMVEQANEIVKLYAGNATDNDNDDIKDKCHVASALFLGPTIHMMCGQKVNDVRQTAYCRYQYSFHTDLVKGNVTREDSSYWNNSPYNKNGGMKPECEDWIDLNANEESRIIYGTYFTGKIQKINNSKNVSGQPSGLCYKFKQYLDTWQGRQDGASIRTVKSNILPEQKMSFGMGDDESIATMSLRDGGSTGGSSHRGHA